MFDHVRTRRYETALSFFKLLKILDCTRFRNEESSLIMKIK